MRKRVIMLLLVFGLTISFCACGQTEIPEETPEQTTTPMPTEKPTPEPTPTPRETVLMNGVECYQTEYACYPAVFGEPQLSDEEISELLDRGSTIDMAIVINTLPDCLNLLGMRHATGESAYNSEAKATLLEGSNQPAGWVEAMEYLLAGDYEDVGRIDMISSNPYTFAAVKFNGEYYVFDPFFLSKDWWIQFPGDNYVSADLETLFDKLKENCHYGNSTFQSGQFMSNVYRPFLSSNLPYEDYINAYKSAMECTITKEELQSMVDAKCSLEDLQGRLSTIGDMRLLFETVSFGGFPIMGASTYFQGEGGKFYVIHNAEKVWELKAGNCGSYSTFGKTVLNGDFDDEGFVRYTAPTGGHVFNYFVKDGLYYFVDFTLYWGKYICYIDYIGDSVDAFYEWFIDSGFPPTNMTDPTNEDYVYIFTTIDTDDTVYRDASSNKYPGMNDSLVTDILPSSFEKGINYLFARDGYEFTFEDF